MQSACKMLLTPIQVGTLRLGNRMVRSPMWSRTSSVDGEVTQQLLDLYENAAKGGPSLIIVEAVAIAERYSWPESQLRIDDVKFMPGLRRLVETIHLNSVTCELQLHCAGAFGRDAISPSGVACYGLGRAWFVQPRAVSIPEVEEIRDHFIAAAVRAKDLECDGVVLHGSTSYLLQQWVSPHTNKRVDRYGGSFENRIQLPLEIVRGIRQKCGPAFVIGYSMVIDEFLPDGITLEESTAFAKALEKEGVDHIDLMAGHYETGTLEKGMGRSPRQPKGLFEKAEIFKRSVSMKIFARCMGEHNPVKWEEALAKGQCDVIQIGRPLLCDPELPKKVKEDRLDDIRLCLRCGQCYETGTIKTYQHHCSLNAELCRERDFAVKRRTSGSKRVLVIGGGPAGLEAARVAAVRGHSVTLMEKETQLGGYARIAALPIGKEEIKTSFIDWLERQCRKAGVEIELGRELSVEVVKALGPDVVIVATGGRPFIPPIPGIDKAHVIIAEDVLTGKAARIGKRVIVAGGGEVGVETADFIAEKRFAESVTIVEMLPLLASDMPAMPRTYLLQVILPKWGIISFTNMKILEITDDEVITLQKDWNSRKFEADTVVNAMGYIPNNTLGEALKAEFSEVYMIGDCVKPRNILHAVHEASYVARSL
jgi:2,4-dienoyl-CoA reductase-like NADH-dependent reductase (Old Yellow Enzyme family)/thioredoxin reductase